MYKCVGDTDRSVRVLSFSLYETDVLLCADGKVVLMGYLYSYLFLAYNLVIVVCYS